MIYSVTKLNRHQFLLRDVSPLRAELVKSARHGGKPVRFGRQIHFNTQSANYCETYDVKRFAISILFFGRSYESERNVAPSLRRPSDVSVYVPTRKKL